MHIIDFWSDLRRHNTFPQWFVYLFPYAPWKLPIAEYIIIFNKTFILI